MKITLSKKILAGFIGCSVILLTVAIVSFRNSEQFLETSQWVNHAYEVLNELDHIRIAAIEAETATRGFVITGKDNYLAPYLLALTDLPEHVRKARELVIDPRQRKNIEALEKLANDHLLHLQACIEVRREDFAKARVLVSTGESRRILNEIRKISDEAKILEQTLLQERKQASEEDA